MKVVGTRKLFGLTKSIESSYTAQKMNFSMKNFFSKFDQIRVKG